MSTSLHAVSNRSPFLKSEDIFLDGYKSENAKWKCSFQDLQFWLYVNAEVFNCSYAT